MSSTNKFKQYIRELVRDALTEMTTTGNVAGYETPFAFSRKTLTPKLAKRTKKIPNQKKNGYKTIPQGDPNGPSSKMLRNEASNRSDSLIHSFMSTKLQTCGECHTSIPRGAPAYYTPGINKVCCSEKCAREFGSPWGVDRRKNKARSKNESTGKKLKEPSPKPCDTWSTSLFYVAMNQSGDVQYFARSEAGKKAAQKYAQTKERHAKVTTEARSVKNTTEKLR